MSRRALPERVDGVAIYALRAEGWGTMYVGSTQAPRQRLYHHMHDAFYWARRRNGKGAWIRSVMASGKQIVMVILEVVPHRSRWKAERKWFEFFGGRERLSNEQAPPRTRYREPS